MNNEIKEILDRLYVYRNENNKYQPEDILIIEDVWLLLDYITNLQQEIERLNKDLDTSIEICNNRQQEIVRLNNIINKFEKYLFNVKQFAYLDELKELKEDK